MTQTLEGTTSLIDDGIRGTSLVLHYRDAATEQERRTILPLCSEQQAYARLHGGETVSVEVTQVRDRLKPEDIVPGGLQVLERVM